MDIVPPTPELNLAFVILDLLDPIVNLVKSFVSDLSLLLNRGDTSD